MQKDLLNAFTAFVITMIALWLMGGFICGDFNLMGWTYGARGWMLVLSLIAGFVGLIVRPPVEEKRSSERVYRVKMTSPTNERNYIIAIADAHREDMAQKQVIKPYIPPTRDSFTKDETDTRELVEKFEGTAG